MVWFVIATMLLVSFVLLLGTSKYLDHIDRKVQKHFEFTRMAIEHLEKTKNYKFSNKNYSSYPRKHYENYGQE